VASPGFRDVHELYDRVEVVHRVRAHDTFDRMALE
jgi:hypothetical protein